MLTTDFSWASTDWVTYGQKHFSSRNEEHGCSSFCGTIATLNGRPIWLTGKQQFMFRFVPCPNNSWASLHSQTFLSLHVHEFMPWTSHTLNHSKQDYFSSYFSHFSSYFLIKTLKNTNWANDNTMCIRYSLNRPWSHLSCPTITLTAIESDLSYRKNVQTQSVIGPHKGDETDVHSRDFHNNSWLFFCL